jgi:gliding motility-associated-like protein
MSEIKNKIKLLLFFLMIISFYQSKGQNWNSNNLLTSNCFIENKGQFIKHAKQLGEVQYALGEADQVLFTNKGFCFRVIERKEVSTKREKESEEHEREEEREKNKKVEYCNVFFEFENANPNCQIIASKKKSDYFTYLSSINDSMFGIKANAYEKFVYQDLYPGIDLICKVDANRSGFEYSLNVDAGADISKFKIKINGDYKRIVNKSDGQLMIKTKFGEILQSAPTTYYVNGGNIKSEFTVNDNLVSFVFPDGYDQSKEIIVDPFVNTNLNALTISKIGFDVDYDYAGNVYVFGGGDATSSSTPFKVAKYNSAGSLIWTFIGSVAAQSWTSIGGGFGTSSIPGNFLVDKVNFKTYLIEGANVNGARLIRIDQSGLYDNFISNQNPSFQEAWDMAFNCTNGQIYACGGGTNSNINFGIVDPSTGNVASSNITGDPNAYQDIVNVVNDFNGNVYAVFAAGIAVSVDNHVFRLNGALNSFVWSAQLPIYSLIEAANKPLSGFSSNGANVLAVNNNYLFYCEGSYIQAYNKTTGSAVGASYNLTKAALDGTGIAVDNCNNIYVGGIGNVLVYNFNGATYTPIGTIPLGVGLVNNRVYDIKYDFSGNLLYVSGDNFVGTYTATQSIPCNGLSVTTSGGCTGAATATVTTNLTGFTLEYIWSNSAGAVVATTTTTALSNTISSLPSGTYNVTVQINPICGGPSSTATVVVSASGGFTASLLTNNPASCSTANNGSLSVGNVVGGTAPFTYSWNTTPVQTTATASNLLPGNYTCIVTDAIGCTYAVSSNVAAGTGFTASVLSNNPASCATASNGSVAVGNLSGGATPFTYSWNTTPIQTTATASGLSPGNYSCTITDANGCTYGVNAIITAGNGFTASLTANSPALCFNSATGTASVGNVVSGQAPFTYSWNSTPVQTSATALNLSAGNYTCIITDANSCTYSLSTTINQPTALSVSSQIVQPICNSAASFGSITLTTSGATSPYSYSWSPAGGSSNVANNLSPNNYTCIVSDANACTSVQNFVITYPPAIIANTISSPTICYGSFDGSATASVQTGGTSPYSYLWMPGNVNGSQINNISAGTYTVTVTDANGCTANSSVAVTQPSALLAIATSSAPSVCSGGSVTLSANGGTTYQWSTGAVTQNTAVTLTQNQTYTVTATDILGCTGLATISVTIDPFPVAAFTADTACLKTATSFNNLSTITAGTISNYSWDFGDGGSSSNYNPTHIYNIAGNQTTTLIATSNKGCIDTIIGNVYVRQLPVPLITADIIAGCPPLEVNFTDQSTSPEGVITSAFWQFGNGFNIFGSTASTVYDQSGLYSVTLTSTTNFGCKKDSIFKDYIFVYPEPIANYTTMPDNPSYFIPQLEFYDRSINASKWFWDFDDGSTDVAQNPIHIFADTGVYYVQLAIENTYGCVDTVVKRFEFKDDYAFWIPLSFSPNNDGKNDVFKVYGFNFKDFEIEIYNRWGQVVYQSNDKEESWNGKYNDKDCPEAVYVFKLKFKDVLNKLQEKSGRVVIIR